MIDGISTAKNHDLYEKNLSALYNGEKEEKTQDEKKVEQELESLKKQDRSVRAHEMAHIGASGGLVKGGPNYKYKTGPDGKRYAIAGDVQIDTSPENDPRKTIAKAEKIIRSALAPADPSSQDRKVASDAQAMKQEALKELGKEKDSNDLYMKSKEKGVFIDLKV